MKKLIFTIVVITTCISSSFARPWWQTAIVDAGGALGGAGSVASLCPACTAIPIGQAAIAVGAILGGASASIAVNIAPPPNGMDYVNVAGFLFLVPNHVAGKIHNLIVSGYFNKMTYFEVEEYIKFLSANASELGIDLSVLSHKDVDVDIRKIIEASLPYNTDDVKQLNELIVSNFSENQDKEIVRSLLGGIQSSENLDSYMESTHPKFNDLRSNLSSDIEKEKLDIFYSIFVHSAALNNPK